jgi:hypothetical protein
LKGVAHGDQKSCFLPRYGSDSGECHFEVRRAGFFFQEIGARELGREIRRALLDCAGLSSDEDWRLHSAFTVPGSEYSHLWVPAFRQLEYPEDASLLEYGHFFATLNIANAYRYAIANPYRPEFIQAIGESLKVLEHLDHSLPGLVTTHYPEVTRLLQNPSPPVVLELSGISRERLLSEKGGHDVEAELKSFRWMQRFSGVNVPAAFRIRDVIPADIVAAHALNDWHPDKVHDSFWRPDASKVAKARHSVHDWLAKEVAS